MKLQIRKTTKIKDLQKVFSDTYPYLKLDFYSRPHREMQLSAEKDKISPEEKISELGKLKEKGMIEIEDEKTVAELEAEFYEKFGIASQVSRRAGDIWIETSLTDNRSLDMQNQYGLMTSLPIESYDDNQVDS